MHRIFVAVDCEEPIPINERGKGTDNWNIDIALGCLIKNIKSLLLYSDIVLLGCTSSDIVMNSLKLAHLTVIARYTLELPVTTTLIVSTRTGNFLGQHQNQQPIDRVGDVLVCSDRLSTRGFFLRGPVGEASKWLASAKVNSAGLLSGNVWIQYIPT
nr:MAG: wsv270-like protein [Penaeus semisulcatus pemonivirus]